MDPILSLPPQQFRAALAELQLDPQREAALLRQYREANSPLAPVFGLLSRIAGGDADAGMQRASMLPVARPEGMSVAEAVRSGQAQLAVPQGVIDAVSALARGVDAPAAAAQGLIPAQDMTGEAMGTAGMAMGAGGLLARPAGSVGMGGRLAADESAAQRVARLLREGRADEVTDDLMAQADPQEMFRLYEAGETGMDLPMDFESRMARARGIGRRDEFHGTTTGSEMTYADAFRGSGSRQGIGFVTSDNPYVASSYADPSFGAVFPMLNPILPDEAPRINAGGNVWSDISVDTPVHVGGQTITARQLTYEPADVGGVLSTNQLSRGASFDYPGIEFSNILDRSIHAPRPLADDGMDIMREFQRRSSDPSTVTMRQDTRGMRSRFARFDPRLSHLRNLNAANVDPLTGLLAIMQAQEPRQ